MKEIMSKLPKHHYLPEFYIRGFELGNISQCFWKYEKSKKRITPSKPVAASEFFYERGANTFEYLPHDPEAVEKMYSEFEGRIAPIHRAILSGEITMGLFEEYLFFIIFLNYRMPVNDALIQKIAESFSPEQLGYAIKNKETGEHISKELENEVTSQPSWKKLHQVFQTARLIMG